jgi:AraC-like DNA-binding protein
LQAVPATERPVAAKPFRRPLPEHLPREVHTHMPEHDACPESAGLSERQFHRLYQQYVGLSPSKMKTIFRLQRTMDAMRNVAAMPALASLAQKCGFYDQAHMNHDVKSITGLTPGDLFQQI